MALARLLQGWLFFQLWVAPQRVPLGMGNAQVCSRVTSCPCFRKAHPAADCGREQTVARLKLIQIWSPLSLIALLTRRRRSLAEVDAAGFLLGFSLDLSLRTDVEPTDGDRDQLLGSSLQR